MSSSPLLYLFLIIQTLSLHSQETTAETLVNNTLIHLDAHPFESDETIITKSFLPLASALDDIKNIKPISKERYWLKITELSKSLPRQGYLHFGRFHRILVYGQTADGIVNELYKGGAFYKQSAIQNSIHHELFPLRIVDEKYSTLFIHLSSFIVNNNPVSSIELQHVELGDELSFVRLVPTTRLKVQINIALLFFLSFLVLGSVLYAFTSKEYKFLSFSFVCLFLFLYFSRNVEGSSTEFIFWSYINEGMMKYEHLVRTAIACSFTIFTILHFDIRDVRPKVIQISVAIFSFSITIAFLRSLYIDSFTIPGPLLQIAYLIDIPLVMINSVVILFLVFKNNDAYAKQFVASLMFFIIMSYLSIGLNETWIGKQENLFSSELYSTYALIIFLISVTYIILKKASIDQTKLLEANIQTQQLTAINKAKNDFISNITHEFKTPISIIKGITEEAEFGDRDRHIIQKSSDNLLGLVNKILDLSQIENEHLNLEMIQGDIIRYLDIVIESLSSLAVQKGIHLSFLPHQKEFVMDFDEDRIKHIHANLLSNAIRYTPKNGEIIVSTNVQEGQFSWSVKDNGQGIPQDEQTAIFQRFYRSTLNQADDGGTGIGLAYVKELVDMMSGKIELKSTIRQGSTFTVQLPISNEAELISFEGVAFTPTDKEVQEGQSGYLSKEDKILLIVEDSPELSKYIVHCLHDQYKCITAYDGQEALHYAEKYLPNLIISDVMMPVMNGYEMTRTLKANDKLSHIPVILLTAKSTQAEKEQGLSDGAEAYLIKPFSKSELRLRVKNIIDRTIEVQNKYREGSMPSRVQKPAWLQHLEVYIRSHLSENLSTDVICKQALMSRTQLHRKLKAITGFSTSEFIKHHRMYEAKQLIQNTDKTIGFIAEEVGYKNAAHFATDYKKWYGESPSATRSISNSFIG